MGHWEMSVWAKQRVPFTYLLNGFNYNGCMPVVTLFVQHCIRQDLVSWAGFLYLNLVSGGGT